MHACVKIYAFEYSYILTFPKKMIIQKVFKVLKSSVYYINNKLYSICLLFAELQILFLTYFQQAASDFYHSIKHLLSSKTLHEVCSWLPSECEDFKLSSLIQVIILIIFTMFSNCYLKLY